MLCWNLSSWFRAGTAESEWVGSLCLSMGECWNMLKPEPSPRWTHQPWQTKVQRLKLLRKCLEEEARCSNHQTLWCQPSVGHLHPHWQVEDSSRQFLATEKQDCHGISMEYFCCQGRISINVIDHPLITYHMPIASHRWPRSVFEQSVARLYSFIRFHENKRSAANISAKCLTQNLWASEGGKDLWDFCNHL